MLVCRSSTLHLSTSVLFGGLFNHWDEVATFQSDHPDVPVFRISYEEMSLVRYSSGSENTTVAAP